MPILPIDKEALWDGCKEIAMENYGLLYVDTEERRKRVIEKYKERASKKKLRASTIKWSDLTKFLAEWRKGEGKKVERLIRLRESVYFIPVVFEEKELGNKEIEKLNGLFEKNIVVSAEMIREEFGIGYDDRLFFSGELAKRKLIKALSEVEGEKATEYYVMGNTLKDSVSTDLFKVAIGGYAEDGLVTRAKLEDAIKVDATNEVIKYLENEDILLRVNNKYLVYGMTEEFARKICEELRKSVEGKIRECNYVMNEAIIRSIIEEKLDEMYNISDHMVKEEVVTSVLNELIQICGLSRDKMHSEILVESAGLGQLAEKKAEEIFFEIKNENKSRDVVTFDAIEMRKDADEKILDLYLNADATANKVIEEKIKGKCEIYINNYFAIKEDEV